MRSDTIRFRPPGVAFDASLRWVLLRAFADPSLPPPAGVDGDRVVELAGELDLAARIGSRVGEAMLRAEVGEKATVALLVASTVADAQAEAARDTVTLLAERAARLGVPLVLLKSAALHASGVVGAGSRPSSDVDVLVPPAVAERLAAELDEIGFRPSEGIELAHQLPMRTREGSASVELHTVVPGLRVRGDRSATVEDLAAAGLLAPAPELPGGCGVPRREVLIAHTLVHGIAQHGLAPASYPLLRVVADLVDLGLDRNDGIGELALVSGWIERDVAPAEVDAVRRLCAALSTGDAALFEPAASGRPEVVVLRHAVAGATDARYRESLKLRGFLTQPRDRGRLTGWLRAVRQAAWISRAEVDQIYGRPDSRLGYAWLRLVRPLDLVRRAVRSGASWLALRLRR